ncbi:MAG: hypothetical protein ABWY02_07100 [Telluria sp.]
MQIELHTYMLALGIGNLSFALLMAAYMRDATPTPGLRTWMWARLAFGATQLLACARPDSGMTVLAVVESAGWTAGLALEVAAYAAFFGYPQLRRFLLPVSGLGLLLACAAPMAGFAHAQLMAVVSTIIGAGSFLVGAVLLHPRLAEATSLQGLIGANDAAFGGVLALSGVMALLDAARAPWLQALAHMAGYMLLIVNGFGFLLMSKERDDAHMERLATTDDLTGLLNRRAFFARADAARMLAQRQGLPSALARADRALYQAKHAGRNRVHSHGAAPETTPRQRSVSQ